MPQQILRVPSRDTLQQGKHLIPSFLELSVLEMSWWRDDFQGDQMAYDATAPGTYQSTASGAASAGAAIQTGVVNGAIRLDPGTADAGRSDLSLGLHYRGDLYATAWWRATTPSAITSFKSEFGFTDVVSGTDAGAVNAKATPTFNASDAVVLVYDTNDDTNLTLVGVKAGVAATAIDFPNALAASTYYYFGVALVDDRARGYLLDADGDLLYETAWMEAAVTATVLLTPWAFVQNRSGAQRVLDIDLLYCYQRRTTSD